MKGFFRRLIYTSFYTLIVAGNYSKFIPLSGVSGNVNIVEMFLYFSSLIYFILFIEFSEAHIISFVLGLLIFLSSMYGAYLHGFSVLCFIQALRLVAMIVAGYVVGKLFFERFSTNLSCFFNRLILSYLWNALLGLVAMILFPQSAYLWLFLEHWGIVMHGDPHIGRFVSPYFDPNLYAPIANIPLICYYSARWEKPAPKWMIFVLALCLFLTFSRSGLTATLVLFSVLWFIYWIPQKVYRIKPAFLFFFCGGVLSLGGLLYWKGEELAFFLTRFASMSKDGSALARLDSAKLGWEIWKEHPLLGVGYNYLSLEMGSQSAFFSLDSSLLTITAAFGSVMVFLFLGILLVWSISCWVRTSNYSESTKILCFSFRNFLLYVWLTILFTSQFNNLLLYPFWLVPIVSIFTYLSSCLKVPFPLPVIATRN